MIKNNIRDYQQEIINVIIKKLQQNSKEIFIEMPSGTGKSIVIEEVIKLLEAKSNILIMNKNKIAEQQFKEQFKNYKNVTIENYYNCQSIIDKFDYIIFNDMEELSEEKYKNIYQIFKKARMIGFCNKSQRISKRGEWLDKKTIDYSITIQQIINDGYMNPNQLENQFQYFIEELLKKLRFINLEKERALKTKKGIMRVDFIIHNNEKEIIVETKDYRSKFVESTIINRAIEQLDYYKSILQEENKNDIEAILIMNCYVSEKIKESTYNEKKILILDISNLIYLSQKNEELMKNLIESIQYNIYDIVPKEPIKMELLKLQKKENISNSIENEIDSAKKFIQRLENIKYGNKEKNDKEYEKLCVQIIRYLFETEFTRILEQNSTEDKMFRMDLVCGLKGTSEFWKILIQHYNTRFVVFEFKNYKEEIDQNLIYITEKYLYNAVLRNVAIIVSRKGFSYNAHKAAIGVLTENGKLIIEIKDDDLITMLRMKADGQDASDYLLNILEEYLISISK